MKGKHTVNIISRKAEYNLELVRKISVIKGKSGSGKSSVIRLISDYIELGKDSGIKISQNTSAKLCVLTNSSDWAEILKTVHNTIIFIDEDVRFLYEENFQKSLWYSDCYAVIISRSGMFTALPFAIFSIYELITKKNGNSTVTSMYQFYEEKHDIKDFDLVLVEDSNSGYEMARLAFNSDKTLVKSACGNSSVKKELLNYLPEKKNICVDVDGAAFGGFIEPLLKLSEVNGNILISAPESFEYLLLKFDVFKKYLSNELTATWDYCDSSEYISWERYFEALIENLTSEHFDFKYTKRKLNNYFKNEKCTKLFLEEFFKCFVKRNAILN